MSFRKAAAEGRGGLPWTGWLSLDYVYT
jgi:hypothetical protein